MDWRISPGSVRKVVGFLTILSMFDEALFVLISAVPKELVGTVASERETYLGEPAPIRLSVYGVGVLRKRRVTETSTR